MKTDCFKEQAQYYPPLSIVGADNNWLNLTAGAVWFFKVCAPQPVADLPKRLGDQRNSLR